MPDPHDAAEPEVLPAVRRAREAAAPVPHRLEHEDCRPAPHRRRQRARGAAAARGRALLLRPGPQACGSKSACRGSPTSSTTTSSAASSSASSAFSCSPAGSPRSSARTSRLRERAAWLSQGRPAHRHGRRVPRAAGTSWARYYALHDGEPEAVADAIEAHYRPRFAGDVAARRRPSHVRSRSPTSSTRSPACSASGSSPPARRIRSGCGAPRSAWCASWSSATAAPVLSRRTRGPPSRRTLLPEGTIAQGVPARPSSSSASRLPEGPRAIPTLRGRLGAQPAPDAARLVPQQLEAVQAFQALPEAESLAAANKRVAQHPPAGRRQGRILRRRRRQARLQGAAGARAASMRSRRDRASHALFEQATTPAT